MSRPTRHGARAPATSRGPRSLGRPAAAAALVLVAWPAGTLAPRPAGAQLARRPLLPVESSQPGTVRRALREASRSHEETVDTWIAISRVAALPGEEAERGTLVAQLLAREGLTTRILSDGNVEARLEGRGGGAPAIISAHLDALHAPTPSNPVRREGSVLRGPGVLDDGSGLAALVGAARALSRSGYRPEREVRFVATVGEEVGLVGSRSYLERNPSLAAWVSIDGILGAVDYGATGIEWRRYVFEGRGGHTLLSTRTPSPSFAAGRAITAIAAIAEGTDDPINVGRLEGGIRANAIPVEVSFTLDVRSDDPERLSRLLRDVERVTRAAARREGVRLREEVLQSLPAVQLAGHARSPLVKGAAEVLDWLELPASTFPRGSSDHNVALLAGIPALAVGATVGRHAHAPQEMADIGMLEKGVQQVVLLAVLLGEGLPEAQGPAQ